MTKSADDFDLTEALEQGTFLRRYATAQGYRITQNFLSKVVRAQNRNPKVSPKEASDEMTINLHMMVNTFIQSLLRTVQKTDELIAATGLLTSEGIPWREENFEPSEIIAEADRLLNEAEAAVRDAKQ